MKSEKAERVAPSDRDAVFKQVRKDLEPIIKIHGEAVVRWALNRWVTIERKRASALAKKREAEKELSELD